MRPNHLAIALLAATGLAGTAQAQSPQFPACPETIEVAQQFTGTAPANWQAVPRPTDRRVADIRFQRGASPTEAFMSPSSGSGPGPTWSLHYEFPSTLEAVHMVCIYANTAFSLVREVRGPLPPRASVTYDHQRFAVTLSYP